MAKSPTPNAISIMLADENPESEVPEIVVQVVDLKPFGNSYKFEASDGNQRLSARFQSRFASDILSGKIQNLGLVRILDYVVNQVHNIKHLTITNCEVVSPALEFEIKPEVKSEDVDIILKKKPEVKAEDVGIILKKKQDVEQDNGAKRQRTDFVFKPKQEMVTKSAAQIIHEQNGNMAPTARMAMTRRVHPIVSLNPYQGNWTIKVQLSNKGNLRSYNKAGREGSVFTVELTDEEGTAIQATMFNEAAEKFYSIFELGKFYYISKGTLKVANKQFRTVQNDYEMNLNVNSVVEEVISEEETFTPETKYNFVQIDNLENFINRRELVDVIGVLQDVSSTISIRRKSDNEEIPKREITLADETQKTVAVSLWGELATNVGEELLSMKDSFPIVAIKSIKIGNYQGLSASAISRSTVLINPEFPEAERLRRWYDSEGKNISMTSAAAGMSLSPESVQSLFSKRELLSNITSDISLGEDKAVVFDVKGYISYIKPDQPMYYMACKKCNKKVSESVESTEYQKSYQCDGCNGTVTECSLRYILLAKICDASGEAWVNAFNNQAERILGCSAEELDQLKLQGEADFAMKLKHVTWAPYLFRLSVQPHVYNEQKRQRISAKLICPVDFAKESRFLLKEISRMKVAS